MKIRDLLYETWFALAANKGRSFLTILGIVIGISAVIAMTALIGGVQNMLMGELGFAQARQVSISANVQRPITFDDVENLERGLPDYEFITGASMTSATITADKGSMENSMVVCAKPPFFTASGSNLKSGRFFSESEEANGARYVVIEEGMIKDLFGSADVEAVGRTIGIGNDEYSVIGVLESAPMSFGGGTAYIPYTTGTTRLGNMYGVSQVVGFVREGVDIEAVTAATTAYVATYYNLTPEEVYVFSYDSVIKEMETTMGSFSLLMGAVASISLFVGGIGIMNMMLTNVTERIREIGLRKSLGARRRDITKQFLLEAIMLCVVGGVIGIVVGLLAAWGLGAVIGAMQPGMSITPAISVPVILGAVGVCVLIGVIFGYYPARRAAKLDPVESLRYQ